MSTEKLIPFARACEALQVTHNLLDVACRQLGVGVRIRGVPCFTAAELVRIRELVMRNGWQGPIAQSAIPASQVARGVTVENILGRRVKGEQA